MNMKSVSYILGWVLNIEAALMALPLITALIYGEKEGFAFAAVMAVCALIGMIFPDKMERLFFGKDGVHFPNERKEKE